jgi:hypothetical protein
MLLCGLERFPLKSRSWCFTRTLQIKSYLINTQSEQVIGGEIKEKAHVSQVYQGVPKPGRFCWRRLAECLPTKSKNGKSLFIKSNIKPICCRMGIPPGITAFLCAASVCQVSGQIACVNEAATTFGAAGCAPTAAANGLVYLDNFYGGDIPNLINGSGLNTASLLSTDMGTTSEGTIPASRDSGIVKYLLAQNTPVAVVGGQAPAGLNVTTANVLQELPTAAYMAGELQAGDAVEFGVYWGNQTAESVAGAASLAGNIGGGGHVMTLTSITINTGGGSGNISFVDPYCTYGEIVPAAVTYGWTLLGYGLIFVQDGFGRADADTTDYGENQGRATGGGFAISDNVVEAVVPEPSTYLAGALLLIPLGVSSLRKLRVFRFTV